jgi:ABC-type transporter Mla MlaB component
MAFNIFPKSPAKAKADEAKKRGPEIAPRHDARSPARPGGTAATSAREIAAAAKARPAGALSPAGRKAEAPRERDITVTGPPSMIEWGPAQEQNILVAEANPGLCAVLEDAALRYANGHAQAARETLEHGIASDDDARASPLAWLALFDLLQRTDDRAAFDQLALQYVVAFERSAPSWEEGGERARPGTKPVAGGYVGFTGKLTAAHAPQIANMLGASHKQPQVRMDLGSLTGADDAGAMLLADALAQLRKRHYALVIQHPEKLRRALDVSVQQGKAAGEGYWILLLELMQWQNDHKAFEDRAVEFAVAFEVSPPSWEPPPVAVSPEPPVSGTGSEATNENVETLVWSGVMTGSSDPQLAKLALFREGKHAVPVDMTAVERVDFVCAGALLNAIGRAEAQRKSVQIMGASPIIRALLLLIGISPRHFIKKAQ